MEVTMIGGKSDEQWQAESDVRTLRDAETIRQGPQRMARAEAEATRQYEAAKVSPVRPPRPQGHPVQAKRPAGRVQDVIKQLSKPAPGGRR